VIPRLTTRLKPGEDDDETEKNLRINYVSVRNLLKGDAYYTYKIVIEGQNMSFSDDVGCEIRAVGLADIHPPYAAEAPGKKNNDTSAILNASFSINPSAKKHTPPESTSDGSDEITLTSAGVTPKKHCRIRF
jgi:hypothetical protein